MKKLSQIISESLVNENVETYTDEIVVAFRMFDNDETYIVAGDSINKIKAQLPPQLKQFASEIDDLTPAVNVSYSRADEFKTCRVFIDEPDMVIVRIN
jgi:hypothetical protein